MTAIWSYGQQFQRIKKKITKYEQKSTIDNIYNHRRPV